MHGGLNTSSCKKNQTNRMGAVAAALGQYRAPCVCGRGACSRLHPYQVHAHTHLSLTSPYMRFFMHACLKHPGNINNLSHSNTFVCNASQGYGLASRKCQQSL